MAITAVIASVAVGTAATVYSVNQQKKAASAQRAASEKQVAMQQQQVARERRSAVRSAVVNRAAMRAQAEAANVATSSGFLGGQTSLFSQLGTNLGFSSTMSGLSQEYTKLTAQAAEFSAKGQMGQAVAGLGFQAAGFASNYVET
jgi:hypothetical protein